MLQFKTVQSKADLKEFIEFPRRIYKSDPHWVPLLSTDVTFTLTENPFWEHAEKQLFLTDPSTLLHQCRQQQELHDGF
jgi:hypothetical protein